MVRWTAFRPVRVHDAPGDHWQWHRRAEQSALKAVQLDDSLAEAHSALGWARIASRDWAGSEDEFTRAISLDPSVHRGFEGLARLYMLTGRPAEQLSAARRGLDVDPYSHSAIREMALALNMNHRWSMETSDARTALAFLGCALARDGRRDEAQRILDDLLAGRRYSHGAFGIAVVYAGLGDYDQVFAWLKRSVEENSWRVYIMDPLFEELHRDPRFRQLGAFGAAVTTAH